MSHHVDVLNTHSHGVSCWSCRSVGIPAKNTRGDHLLLFVGIIDILQSYRLSKKVEHTLKAMVSEAVSWWLI